MLRPHTYFAFLKNLPGNIAYRKGRAYTYFSYSAFEFDWDNYYNNIFLPNYIQGKTIRVFIAESAPEGKYPNPNYIFSWLGNNIDENKDKYLYRLYRGIFPRVSPNAIKLISKQDSLIQLAKVNVLIVDMLPTHGIKMTTEWRKYILNHLLGNLNLNKILNVSSLGRVNYAFAIPPSLYKSGMLSGYLSSHFTEFANVNTGQGHAPSVKAIEQIVRLGF